jgi:integrase
MQSLRGTGLLCCWPRGAGCGEVVALRREDIDLDAGTVTVRHNRVELLESPSAAFDADPKTDGGKRTVAVPPHVLPFFQEHMAKWAGSDRVFVGRDGQAMRGDAIRQAFTRARRKVGMPGFRFHDLRHRPDTGRLGGSDHQGSHATARPCVAGRGEPLPPHRGRARRPDCGRAVRTR